MYKPIAQYARNLGMTVDNRNGIAYGHMNGYFITITQDSIVEGRHLIQFWVRPGSELSTPPLNDFLNQCRGKYEHLYTQSYNGRMVVAGFEGKGFQWAKKYVPAIDAFLKELTAFCHNYGMVQGCASCGTEYNLNLYQLDHTAHMLCPACYAGVNNHIQQNVAQKKQSGNGNLIGGIIGSLIGALLGVAIWVIIYQLGYISALGSIAMIFFALKGYEILGGRLNILGITISCIISFVMLFFAENLCIAIEIHKAYPLNYSIIEALQSLSIFLNNSDVKSAYLHDIIIGFIFMVVAACTTVGQAYKSGTGKVNTRILATVTNSNPSAMN